MKNGLDQSWMGVVEISFVAHMVQVVVHILQWSVVLCSHWSWSRPAGGDVTKEGI